jgi:hypothetical protein
MSSRSLLHDRWPPNYRSMIKAASQLLGQACPLYERNRVAAMKLRHGWGTPTFVLVRRGVGMRGDTPLISSDEIDLPSLRILQEFIKRRGF